MENVILGLLILHSLTLYEMNHAFKQGISMFYSASYGSLQIAVKNLLAKGLIGFEEKVERGRNKKVYSITDSGRRAFFEWMMGEVPLNRLEVTALSRVYFLGLMDSLEQKKHILQEIIRKIDLVQGQLDDLNGALSQAEIPPDYRQVFHYQLKTLDYGRQAHVFARQWFAACLAELDAEPPR